MKTIIKYLSTHLFNPHYRLLWAFLACGFVFYESCGLYFQYILHLNPCIECVYERACFMFFGIAAIIGLIIPRFMFMRLIATGTWLTASIWGLIISIEHRKFEIAYQEELNNPFGGSGTTCGFFAEFPSWFKLDQWLPSVFNPTGICGDAAWSFASLTMVQWVEIIFLCNTVVATLVLLVCFIPFKKMETLVNK